MFQLQYVNAILYYCCYHDWAAEPAESTATNSANTTRTGLYSCTGGRHSHFLQSPGPSLLPLSSCALTRWTVCGVRPRGNMIDRWRKILCLILLQTQNCPNIFDQFSLTSDRIHVYLEYKINGFLVHCSWECKLVKPLWRTI